MKLQLLPCRNCQRPVGYIDSPTKRELGGMLAGSPLAGAVAFMPANVADALAQLPLFVCLTCQPIEDTNGSSKPARK